MSEQTPIAPDHPLKLAWDAYTETEEYANSKKWAEHFVISSLIVQHEHLTGSLWAVFSAGFEAGQHSREGKG